MKPPKQKTRSDPVSTPEAIAGADCPECGAEKGDPCVFMVNPAIPYPPGTEPQSWMTQTAQDYLRQVGTTTRVAHNRRRAAIRNRRPVRPKPTGPTMPGWHRREKLQAATRLRENAAAMVAYDRRERAELADWLEVHGDMFRNDYKGEAFRPEYVEAEARRARILTAFTHGLVTSAEGRQELIWTETLYRRAKRD